MRNNTLVHSNAGGYTDIRCGGVFCDGGSIVNCYIIENKLGDNASTCAAYGAGCYMYSGTAYNCVIAGNVTTAFYADGAGIFIENAEFYNNTIVNNVSNAGRRGSGGICIWRSGGSSDLTIYNCIVIDNRGFREGMYGERMIHGNENV